MLSREVFPVRPLLANGRMLIYIHYVMQFGNGRASPAQCADQASVHAAAPPSPSDWGCAGQAEDSPGCPGRGAPQTGYPMHWYRRTSSPAYPVRCKFSHQENLIAIFSPEENLGAIEES